MPAADVTIRPALSEDSAAGGQHWLEREWFFWMVFASWTVLPSSWNPLWWIGGILVKATDLLFVPLCFLYYLPRMVKPPANPAAGLHKPIMGGFALLTLWGAVSTLWSGSDTHTALAMAYTMLVSFASAWFAYLVIISTPDLRPFLLRLVIALTGVGLLYTAQSVLGLGFREATVGAIPDFGMERVRGPLFESSTGFFLLIPAMGLALQEAMAKRIRPEFGLLLVLCLAMANLGLGSRAGIALFVIFSLTCVGTVRPSRRGTLVCVLLLAALGAGYVIFSKASVVRFQTTAKDDRALTHETVAEILKQRRPEELALGSGLGSLWPWYVTETEGGDLWTSRKHLTSTIDGVLLYHPHSSVLYLVAEMGAPGLMFLGAMAVALILALRRTIRQNGVNAMFAASMAVSIFSIGVDFFWFRRPTRDVVWWLFFFGMLSSVAQEKPAYIRRWRWGGGDDAGRNDRDPVLQLAGDAGREYPVRAGADVSGLGTGGDRRRIERRIAKDRAVHYRSAGEGDS